MKVVPDRLWPLRGLIRASRLTRDEIVAFRDRQLRAVIAHAYERVPYYRELLDKIGLAPEDIRTVADLPAIPVTTKRDLYARPVNDLVTRGTDVRKLILRRTSGSTGEPFVIRRAIFEEILLRALRHRALRYFGLRPLDRRAGVGLVRPNEARGTSLGVRIFLKTNRFRTTVVHSLLEPEEILRALRAVRPHIITGFASTLARVAQCMGNEDRRLIRPRFVTAGGEVLTPLMRRQIREGFRVPLFETYGSHEFNLIGWECMETGEFHTCDDGVIVEVLKDGHPAGPGEQGELVGTSLHAFTVPFIRYRLGDLVTVGSPLCRCGQPFATLREIHGRTVEYFELPDGRTFHPWEIVLIFIDRAPWIRQYQLVQERRNRILLRAVAGFTPSARELALVTEPIGAHLGPAVEFVVDLVPEIRPGPNGKLQVFRSMATTTDPSALRD